MAQPIESSDFLTQPHRSPTDRRPWVAAVEHNSGSILPKATNGHRIDMLARAVQPAEVAQARLFEGILQAEFAELTQLAYRMAGSLDRQPGAEPTEPPRDLLRIRERMNEVHRLIQALQGRFPQPRWDGELLPE
ncbi:hypothetical protein H7K24_00930 [Mycobacterium fragae]|nr:hypothetical protein [Mycobacterium fragae]MCV7398719.1 hypothetical protein [Mycobacterium fragae]